jgi:hypothetical protein
MFIIWEIKEIKIINKKNKEKISKSININIIKLEWILKIKYIIIINIIKIIIIKYI